MKPEDILTTSLIAPCGMNCGLCRAYLRAKKPCPGCFADSPDKPGYCTRCHIKNCPELAAAKAAFCGTCITYPCRRLRQLDKRYRAKYGMSMLQNLEAIRRSGVKRFVKAEIIRWKCPACGHTICVHKDGCLNCGQMWDKSRFCSTKTLT